MKKLPEKWCIKITRENLDFCQKLKGGELGFLEGYDYTIGSYYGPMVDRNGWKGSSDKADRTEITFDQFKRLLLGETEEWEPKAGEWVVSLNSSVSYKEGEVCQIGHMNGDCIIKRGDADSSKHKKYFRPARPEEIPQEEVEYVECIISTSPHNRVFKVGEQYIPDERGETWFKYQGQLYSFMGSTLAFKRVPKNNQVNKCSTINTNQNGTTKSENSKTNDTMDSIPRGTGGQEIRLRTKSSRIICESGLPQSGREITGKRRSSKRPKAEIGDRFV